MDSTLKNFLLVLVSCIALLKRDVNCNIGGVITVKTFAERGLTARVQKYPLKAKTTITRNTQIKDYCQHNTFYPADPLEIIENVRAAEDCVVMCRQNAQCLASSYFYMSKKCFTSKAIVNQREIELFREMDAQYCEVFHISHNPQMRYPAQLPSGNPMRCGETRFKIKGLAGTSRRSKRILGGGDLYEYYALPFMVRMQDANDGEVLCGATLIAADDSVATQAKYALTSAHCISGFPPGSSTPKPYAAHVSVYAASHDVRFTEAHTQKRVLKRAYVHPEFKPDDEFEFINDLAIVTFDQPFSLNAYVGTACVPPKQSLLSSPFKSSRYAKCFSAGWGHFYEEKTGQFDVRINQQYPHSLRISTHKVSDGKKNLLFVEPDGEYPGEILHGDSGAPLACLSEGRYYVRGVASERSFYETYFKREWKTRNHFTNVALATGNDWIKKVLQYGPNLRPNKDAYIFNY